MSAVAVSNDMPSAAAAGGAYSTARNQQQQHATTTMHAQATRTPSSGLAATQQQQQQQQQTVTFPAPAAANGAGSTAASFITGMAAAAAAANASKFHHPHQQQTGGVDVGVKWERALKLTSCFRVADADYERVDALLLDEMLLGLAKDTNREAVLKMLPTYVHDVPDGSERGQFLALDLGGTNFRVLAIDLKPNRHFDMRSKIFAVPQDVMTGTGEQLFDHIAECIARFMEQEKLKTKILPLGFTFSFPCTQTGLTSSELIRWTKGFNASNVEGQDVVKLLLDAVRRRGDYDIQVVAVVNDTTGTLMSCAFQEPTCAMGLIVGTGTNACYMERLELVEMWRANAENNNAGDSTANNDHLLPNDEAVKNIKQIIVNMEWGAFGDNGRLDFVRTEFDRDIDEHSINPGMQVFEKMISGMYMGELVRLVLVKLAREGILFNNTAASVAVDNVAVASPAAAGVVPEALLERNAFFTKYVSEIESDDIDSFTRCRSVLEEELGIAAASELDCRIVRLACESVSSRAGYLCGTAVATVLNHMGRERATVAVDGSVYKYHPKFHDLMEQQCKKFLHKGLSFKLMLSEDGSGKGAALVAAVAVRLARQKLEDNNDDAGKRERQLAPQKQFSSSPAAAAAASDDATMTPAVRAS